MRDERQEGFVFDNDEDDDFGLPSATNLTQRMEGTSTKQNPDPGGGWRSLGMGLGENLYSSPNLLVPNEYSGNTRRLSNSADIAIERPAPAYATSTRSEGKILRPQYKEILRGLSCMFAGKD